MDRILIAPATLAGLDILYLKLLRDAGFEAVFPPMVRQLTEAETLDQLKGIKATIAGSEPYTKRVLDANPQLRVIARAGVGYDAVDVSAATERGMAVTTTPGTNQDAVAEHTFAMMLSLAKSIVWQHLGTVAGKWPRRATIPLRGRVLGIAGLGRIGKSVAIRGAAFGMKLIAFEPFPDKDFVAKNNIKLVTLDGLLTESDYLTLHIPLMAESRNLIGKEQLAKMKPTSYLINTSRGGLINEKDLAEALQQKRLAGAAIDVFEEEPPPVDHPLLHMENSLVTPHAAGVDLQSRDDMATSAAQAIIALSRGEWPAEQVVNPQVRAKFQW